MKNKQRRKKKRNLADMPLTMGIKLKKEDMHLAASQWKAFFLNLRILDDLQIKEIEPATIFFLRT